jgi:hypothetical protein
MSQTLYFRRQAELHRKKRNIGLGVVVAAVPLYMLGSLTGWAYLLAFLSAGLGGFYAYLNTGFGNQENEKRYQEWLKIPMLEDYFAKHPESKTKNGPACFKCSSRSHKSWGLHSKGDSDRTVSCRACGTTLYRI